MPDPFLDALAGVQAPRPLIPYDRTGDPFLAALAPKDTDEPDITEPGLVSRGLDLLSRLPDVPGLRQLFRTLRVPQQALITGPARAIAEAARTDRPITPQKVLRGSLRAVAEDASLRDVAREAGISHPTVVGLVADLVVDPLWIVTPAKLARASGLVALAKTRPVQRAVAAVKATRPAQALGKALVYRFGQPAAYAERAEEMVRDVQRAVTDATELGQRIARLTPAEQRAVRSYMIAGNNAAQQTVLVMARAKGLQAERVGELAAEALTRDVQLGKELMDVGLMSEQTFLRWKGKHLRREFVRHENPLEYVKQMAAKDPERAARLEATLKQQSGWIGAGGPLRERLAFLRQRKDLPDDVLRELGEILEAAHPVAKGQALAGRAVAMRRFLTDVKTVFASPTRQPGYRYLGDTSSLGPLQKMYLPEAIAEDVTRVVNRPAEAWRLWRQGIGWWKYGKVVLNPATHARNTISNLMLADLAGLAPYKIHRYGQALRSLVTKDEWYQEAKAAGSFLVDTFAGRELPRLLEPVTDAGTFRRVLSSALAPLRKAADLYQGEEQLFKMAFFINRRKAGDGAKVAAKAADRALFNYRQVPRFIDTLRTYGIVPFLTFPYKALPATARALVQRPAAVSRYGQIMRSFEAPDSATERAVLPEHMRDAWMRLPGTDRDGRVRYLNLQYILPFGDIGETATLGGFVGRGGAKPGFLSSPLADTASALVSGRDPFTGQEIERQAGGWTAYLTNLALPPLAGGYAARELKATLEGRPVNLLSRTAEPRTLPQTLAANIAGIRIRPMNLAQERQRRIQELAYEIRDVRADARRWQRAKYVTPAERDAAIAEYAARIRELVREVGELRGLTLPGRPVEDEGPTIAVEDPFTEALEAATGGTREPD